MPTMYVCSIILWTLNIDEPFYYMSTSHYILKMKIATHDSHYI